MAALSGKVAKVKMTAVAPTSSTGEAGTKLSTGVYQITDASKRFLDREATGAPIVYLNTTVHGSSEYAINYAEGKITFDPTSYSTGTSALTVDVHYLTASYLGHTKSWEAEVNTDMHDVTVFATAAGTVQWKKIQPGLSDASVTLGRFHSTATPTTEPIFFDRINLENSLVVDLHMQDYDRLVGFGHVETDAFANDVDTALEETVTIKIDGPLYYTTSS